MYGRIAQFIDCTGVSMPAYERPLCPRQPPAQRNPDFYMWAPQSPQVTLKAPPGMSKDDIIIDFDRRIIEHQPLTYLKVVAGDVLYSFSPVRGDGPEHYPIWYHQFHTYYPPYPDAIADPADGRSHWPDVEPALAGFLSGYGRDFYVPGPLLAAGLALGAGRNGGYRPGAAQRAARALPAVHARHHRRGRAAVRHRRLRLAVRTAATLAYPDRRGSRRNGTGRPVRRGDTAAGGSLANTDQLVRPGQSATSGKPAGATGGTAVDVDPQVM